MTDYSDIDSNQKAEDLYKQGKLSILYLMPLEFGGEDSPVNILYAPEAAVEQKEKFDGHVEQLLEHDFNLSYSAEPEYKGNSFIPSRLVIRVGGDKEMTETIDIW
jgi:hypothetical protein